MQWTQIISVIAILLGAGGVGALVKHWLDYKQKSRAGTDDVLMRLVNQLNGRVKVLERSQAIERAAFDASSGIMRHKMANLKQCFDSLLMLVESDPSRASEFVVTIKAMRERQEATEAFEKATIEAAKIAAAAAYDHDTDEGHVLQ